MAVSLINVSLRAAVGPSLQLVGTWWCIFVSACIFDLNKKNNRNFSL